MKQVKVIFLLLSVLCTALCPAQQFKVVKATKQDWSGGVAGHYGTYYHIEVQTANKAIIPDTVWINGNVYPVDFSIYNNGCHSFVDSVSHKITYTISVEEAHYEDPITETIPLKDTATGKPHIRHVTGAALISYINKGSQHFYTITTFTELEPIAYP